MITKIQNLIPKLIFSVLITTIIVSTFSLSRFQTAKAGASDVSVAYFIVSATGSEEDKLTLDCNSNNPIVSYDVVVTNKKDNSISGVTIKYDVVVEFSEALPSGITISDGKTTLNSVEGQNIYLFNDIGNFSAGLEKSNTHTITLAGSSETLSTYSGNMSIYVDATQID